MKVTTAEFVENFSLLAARAASEPVTITADGRDRLVVISADEYARLMRGDRHVVKLEDFTAAEITSVLQSNVPPGYEHLDAELDDWRG